VPTWPPRRLDVAEGRSLSGRELSLHRPRILIGGVHVGDPDRASAAAAGRGSTATRSPPSTTRATPRRPRLTRVNRGMALGFTRLAGTTGRDGWGS
jgi:hypothetical protein